MSKILSIFFFFVILKNSLQNFALNFKTNIDLNQLNDDNYMNTTLDQKLYVIFDMGDSHQNIPMTIKSQQLPTFIVSSKSTDSVAIKYDETKSPNSFHYINNFLIEKLYKYDFNEGYLVNDTVTFNSSLVYKNFSYMLATKVNVYAKNISGEIGLSKKKNDEYPYLFPERTQFLQQLKDNKLINNKIFGIVYDNDNDYEGKLIFGAYLDQIDDLYSEDDKITNYIDDYIPDDNRDKWLINFNVKLLKQPYNEEVYIEENTYGLAMYEIGLIVGSRTFRENFIIDYFERKGCNESLISSKPFGFYQYSCDNENQFSDFPDLIFTMPGKYMFNFTKNELFKKIGKKYIFQIVFEIIDLEINYWRLGQNFFRKYHIFFNWDEKECTFSYYNRKYKQNENEQEKSKITLQIIFIIILSIILLFLIGVIIYFYFFCEKKRRKRAAQELKDDEDYDYTPAVNIIDQPKNNQIINSSN